MAFKVGDKVIYPNQGVGVIEDVKTKTIGGHAAQFYMVRLTANDSTVMVPVNNAEHVGVRNLSSESQVKDIFAILESDFPEPEADWKTRYKTNLEKMNTGEICEVAKVLRNLYFLSFKKSLSFREKRMYDRARSLVVSEVATVKGQGIDHTEKLVDEVLNNSYQKTVETVGS